jgi:DNA-binding transcriptional MerR regulator
MNIKEIAEITNVNKTTVQRWFKKIPDAKRIEIDAKCIESIKSQKPADFTLDETIEIIKAGGNNTLADLLLENSKMKNSLIPLNTELSADKKDEYIIKTLAYMVKELTEIKKQQLQITQVKKEITEKEVKINSPKITFQDKNMMKVLHNDVRYLIAPSYYGDHKWDIRLDTSDKYPPSIKKGLLSQMNAFKYIERNL